jgi:hypothetical protein
VNGKSSPIRERQLSGEQFGTASARSWPIRRNLKRRRTAFRCLLIDASELNSDVEGMTAKGYNTPTP